MSVSFWIGFGCGMGAAWALSIIVLVLAMRPWRPYDPD